MRIIETKVFTIVELEGEALAEATKQVAEVYVETSEYALEEIVESARKAAEFFRMELVDWSVGYYNRNYASTDTSRYMDLSNEEKNDLVAWLNENYEEGSRGSCPFTGVMYDCYFFEYIKEVGGVTYNNLHKIVPEAIDYLVSKAMRAEEDWLMNDEYVQDYAYQNGWEFTEYGNFYGYGA